MRMRYWSLSVLMALGSGFLIVEALVFRPSAATPIAFAVAIALTLTALAATYVGRSRERKELWTLPALAVLIGGWTIIAMTGIFPLATERWLAFASGCALLAVSIVALALHEVTTERVVHALEIGTPEAAPEHATQRPTAGVA